MDRREIRREWRAQIAKAREAGIPLRQLNAHGHLHLLPQLHGVVVDLVREFDIADVRLIRSFDSPKALLLHACSLELGRRLRRAGLSVAFPRRTLGLRTPGSIDSRLRVGAVAVAGAGASEF